MIERLIISNLRRAQAFDRNLRAAAGIESIAARFINAIMFQRDGEKRSRAIDKLKFELFDHIQHDVFPQAERIGNTNAIDIARRLPKPKLEDVAERERLLFSTRQPIEQRLRIVQSALNEQANTLDARLTRYWLEPGEGGAAAKMQRLQEIHSTMEDRRKTYESKLREFTEGKIDKRPSKPNLDYMSKLTDEAKSETRAQARRAGTDAEIATFAERGHTRFVWVVPNAGDACPDCKIRAGVAMTLTEWDQFGRPGTGQTICGTHCFCMLLPYEIKNHAASLAATVAKVKPVLTTPVQRAFFDRHRIRP